MSAGLAYGCVIIDGHFVVSKLPIVMVPIWVISLLALIEVCPDVQRLSFDVETDL